MRLSHHFSTTGLSFHSTMAPFQAERYQRVVLPDNLLQSHHAVFGKSGLLGAEGSLERFDIWYHPPRRRQPAPGGKQTPSRNQNAELVVFDLQVGHKMTGHEGLVHGGIISLLFDEAIGWGYQCFAHESQCRGRGDGSHKRRHVDKRPAIDQAILVQWKDLDATPPAVTANLNVTYKRPLPAGQRCLLRVYHVRSEGRKHHFDASLEMCRRNTYGNNMRVNSSKTADIHEQRTNATGIIYAEATCLMVEVNDTQLSRL